MIRHILAVLAATVWISLSEFIRNTFLLRSYWVEHYQQFGQQFPEQPINGAIWGLWSLSFAAIIYFISQKYSLIQTTILTWGIGFVLMWLVIGNLGVLPYGILPLAIPLSIVEAWGACFIIRKIAQSGATHH